MTWKTVFLPCVLAGITALIAYFPAAWVAAGIGQLPSEAVVTGTLWRGQVSGLKGIAPVNFQTLPARALTGQSFFTISSNRPDFTITGMMGFGRAEDVAIDAQVSALASSDKRLVNLKGGFELTLDELRFDSACQSASGYVRSDVLQRNERLWRWKGPLLEGPIDCAGERLRVTLAGEDGPQSAEVIIEISADGRYSQRALVSTQNKVAQSLLGLYGFEEDQGAYKLLQLGQWR